LKAKKERKRQLAKAKKEGKELSKEELKKLDDNVKNATADKENNDDDIEDIDMDSDEPGKKIDDNVMEAR
jgi:hypothetical protein